MVNSMPQCKEECYFWDGGDCHYEMLFLGCNPCGHCPPERESIAAGRDGSNITLEMHDYYLVIREDSRVLKVIAYYSGEGLAEFDSLEEYKEWI